MTTGLDAIYLAAIVNSSDDAIMGKDLNGIITSWNPAAAQIFGYAAEEVIGRSIAILLPPDRRSEQDLIIARIQRGERVEHFETVRQAKDGRDIPVSLTISPIRGPDGAVIGASKIARDISERKQAEQDRERYMEELRRSNSELAQFAHAASHDLKAPLRAIQNLAGWIAEDLRDTASIETRENLALLQRRGERLENLLSGLLTYSRAGHIKAKQELVDTAHLVDEIVEYLAPPPGFAIVRNGAMPVLRISKAPFEQVMRNLIGNAVKHHDRNAGTISVAAQDSGNEVAFTVQDDGPGIDPAYHERIFAMFQTLKPRDEVEGSGIGLAIVKKAVEAHGGQIRVESEPPRRGTAFIFTWRKEEKWRSRT